MSGEKTEQPTPKKLREARRDGKVPRSADFTGVFVMLAAGTTLYLTSQDIVVDASALVVDTIELAFASHASASEITARALVRGGIAFASMVAPVVLTGFVAAAALSYLQVGPAFTTKPVVPDGERLNFAHGLKRFFSKDRLVDLAKNVVRLSAMIAIGIFAYGTILRELVQTTALPVGPSIPVIISMGVAMASSLLLALGVLGIIDLLLQRHRHFRDLRMSKQEIRDEYKQSEGDPMMKSERRRQHRELLRSAGIEDVENADVVVVNPTHVAVALRYRAEEMNAPRVVARGRGEVAAEIKRRARRHRVPVVRDVRLARSLVELELDDEIPDDLFEPVAEVLHFVYNLRSSR